LKLLFDNGNQHISGDRTPDLRLHRVLAVADKTFDTQMLLDPLEEQLDLPAALVQCGNRQCGQGCVVGQEHQRLAGFRVFEANASQLLRVILRDIKAIQQNALVADDPSTPVGLHRIHPVRIHTPFGAGHKERPRLMHREQAAEIQIAPIHHVKSACLESQHVQHLDLVDLAIGDVDESRDVAAQIQQGVQPDRRFGGAERCPWKQRQAQVDGRGIQRVDRVGQFDAEAVVAVQLAGAPDQCRRQRFPDTPVAALVGIGQRRTFDGLAQAHSVQLRLIGQQAHFDVAQALAVGQLGERHGPKLFGASQAARTGIAAIARHDSRKARPWHKLHDLCEQRLAHVHSSPPENLISGSYLNLNG